MLFPPEADQGGLVVTYGNERLFRIHELGSDPRVHGVADPALNLVHGLAAITFEPVAVEGVP